MRMVLHTVKTPTWTRSAYGEPVAEYTEVTSIPMMIGWTSMVGQDQNNSLYQEYEFVGLTKSLPEVGSLVDDKYVIGHVEKGRWNRVFMKYAEGKDRTYGNGGGNNQQA